MIPQFCLNMSGDQMTAPRNFWNQVYLMIKSTAIWMRYIWQAAEKYDYYHAIFWLPRGQRSFLFSPIFSLYVPTTFFGTEKGFKIFLGFYHHHQNKPITSTSFMQRTAHSVVVTGCCANALGQLHSGWRKKHILMKKKIAAPSIHGKCWKVFTKLQPCNRLLTKCWWFRKNKKLS